MFHIKPSKNVLVPLLLSSMNKKVRVKHWKNDLTFSNGVPISAFSFASRNSMKRKRVFRKYFFNFVCSKVRKIAKLMRIRNLNLTCNVTDHLSCYFSNKSRQFPKGGSLGCWVSSVFWFSHSVFSTSLPEKWKLFYYKIDRCNIWKNLYRGASQSPFVLEICRNTCSILRSVNSVASAEKILLRLLLVLENSIHKSKWKFPNQRNLTAACDFVNLYLVKLKCCSWKFF